MAEYKIGSTLLGMSLLETILSRELGDVLSPDASFRPYATAIELADGSLKGQGFPVAIWRFNHLSEANRQILKNFITGLSGSVYIRTDTNESSGGALVWKNFLCKMKWTPEDEDKVAGHTLGIVLTFTHLVEQA